MKRRRIPVFLVLLFVIFTIILCIFNEYSNAHVRTTHYTCTSANLPASFNGTKLLVISDLHNAPFAEDILQIARTEEPDLVLFTGDMVELPYANSAVTAAIASGLQEEMPEVPLYFITGNHESQNPLRDLVLEELTSYGIVNLDNRFVSIERESATLGIAGLADQGNNYVMTHQYEDYVQQMDAYGEMCDFLVVLNHRADMYPQLAKGNADLILAGHLHGGVVRLPLVGPVVGREGTLFPDYAYGYYEPSAGEAAMVVSGGCDQNSKKKRIFNPPEVVVVTLTVDE